MDYVAQETVFASGKRDMYEENRRVEPHPTGFPNANDLPDLLNAGFSTLLDLTEEISLEE
jgi:hypothetical protein